MSLGKFLKKIWAGIKKAFEGLVPELKKAVTAGVEITDKLKALIDGPIDDMLVALIPGDFDDKIRAKLQEELPKILVKLKLAESCLAETDPNKIVECALNTLRDMTSEDRKPFLHSFAILTAQVIADGKLTWSDGVFILQWLFKHKKGEA